MKATYPGIVGTIEVYMKVLRAICGDTAGKSMIDLCCCTAPNTPKLGFLKRRYFDVQYRTLDHPEEQQFFSQTDVTTIRLAPERIRRATSDFDLYDVAICSDGIEHLHPKDGHDLIDNMPTYSHKQIIFTPLGELFKLHNTTEDDPEAHHSVWSPGDFPGWASIVFPDYHKVWNGGAFFAWHCEDIKKDFKRVINIIQL